MSSTPGTPAAPVTTGQRLASDVAALIRSRHALLWVVSAEEARVERSIQDAAESAEYAVRFWDCIAGITNIEGKAIDGDEEMRDPARVLAEVNRSTDRAVWVFRDLHKWLDPTVLRSLRNLARTLPQAVRKEARVVIVLSPSSEVPPELADCAVVVKWQLPDREEIKAIYDRQLEALPEDVQAAITQDNVREAAVEAAVGLSAEMAASCYAKSLVTQGRRIVPAVIAAEKKRVVSGKGVEWFDADPRGLDAIGGLENLKAWLRLRRSAFSERARAFGLPAPKGALIVGPPGGGKSLTAKCLAAAWGVPLLKLDLGGAKSKWVGESESNIRQALAVADAIGNCVVWLDEVEKSLGGATSGAADGGVSSDALGTLLTWMQDRKSGAFVIATANDVTKLPPELLRKGRFDDLWYVDLPTTRERAEILAVTLKQYGRDPGTIDLARMASATRDFTGAEIAALVPDALFVAFAEGERALTTEDLLRAAGTVVPLAKTAADKIRALREWCQGRARPCSVPEAGASAASGGRALDM